ncbi:hypothetical protein BV898_04153 [Hypsibius exemplaris]|uniref:Gustatory receptor n=1 Tax=Hypsibius exemplaris TaxID=2072580 RepID=A0A1W0X3F9_HYPEX|nr:hypothetical protein BV898_04153 [Hypsibius exemplaris]
MRDFTPTQSSPSLVISLFPDAFVLWLRLVGLLAYRYELPKSSKPPERTVPLLSETAFPKLSPIWLFWSLVLIAFAVLVCLADFILFVKSSTSLITGLEFFTLVFFLFRSVVQCSMPVIISIQLIQGRHLPSLLSRVQKDLSSRDFQRIKTLRNMFAIWIVLLGISAGFAFAWALYIFVTIMRSYGIESSIYAVVDFYPFTGISQLGQILIYIAYIMLSTICFLLQETLFFLMVYACKLRLVSLSGELSSILIDCRGRNLSREDKALHSQRIRFLNRKHITLQDVVEDIATTFSASCLTIWSVRDLAGCLCLLAFLFRREYKQTFGAEPLSLIVANLLYQESKPILIVVALIAVVLAVTRIVSCHSALNENRVSLLLPDSFILWLRLAGLFVYRNELPKSPALFDNIASQVHTFKPNFSKVSYPWLLWTLALIAFAVTVCLADLILFVKTSATLLTGLEFFTLVFWIFRFLIQSSVPVIISIQLLQGRHLPSLLSRVQEDLTPNDFRRIRILRNTFASWIILVCLIAGFATAWALYTFVSTIRSYGIEPSLFTVVDFYPFTGISHLGENLIYVSYIILVAACLSLEEVLFILLLYVCKLRLANLSEELVSILHDDQRETLTRKNRELYSQRIRDLNRKHAKIQTVVEDITATFGVCSMTVWSLRDVAGCLCLLAFLFRREYKQPFGTDPRAMIMADLIYEESKPILIMVALFSVAHAVIRIVSCLGVLDENHEIRKGMTKATAMEQVVGDSNLSFECTNFLERLEMDELHISPYGFYSISLEYGLSLIGLVVSYFLIMYQIQDQKVDMESLMGHPEAAYFFGSLVKNVSEICTCP